MIEDREVLIPLISESMFAGILDEEGEHLLAVVDWALDPETDPAHALWMMVAIQSTIDRLQRANHAIRDACVLANHGSIRSYVVAGGSLSGERPFFDSKKAIAEHNAKISEE